MSVPLLVTTGAFEHLDVEFTLLGEVLDNFSMELAAALKDFSDTRTFLYTAGYALEDTKTSFLAVGEDILNAKLSLDTKLAEATDLRTSLFCTKKAYYVRSTTGSDSNNGSSWALAKQTITGALNVASAGEIIYVSQAHNYYVAANIAYPSSKGTASAPILVVCVNDAQEPPTQLATTAIENNTATASTLGFPIGSHYHWYGITFKSAGHLYLPRTCPQRFENCTLQLTGTTSGVWHLNTGQSYGYANTQFVNTTFTAAFAGSYFYIYNGYGWGSNGWPHSFNFSFKGCT